MKQEDFKRSDIKRFREILNVESRNGPLWKGGKNRGQRKREYGDYLYAQDREKFLHDLEEWLAGRLPQYGDPE